MTSMRTKHAPAFKVRVALEAYKEEKTSSELAGLSRSIPALYGTGRISSSRGRPIFSMETARSIKTRQSSSRNYTGRSDS